MKMAAHSHDDYLMCRVFPSGLKELALDWSYSLLSRSPRSFKEVSDVFFNQHASQQEFKKNSNHLLTLKMKPEETLKRYISLFQRQIVMIYNYRDVAAPAFIVGLQTVHSFYKHLMKHDINMEILPRAQKYVQLEEATRDSTIRSPKQESKGEKTKP